MLVEIRSAIWNVHRMGFSNSLQHKDLDSAMVFITAMYRAIPEEYRKDLPPRPVVSKMEDHLALKRERKMPKLVKPHSSKRKCPMCAKLHTKNEHRFHGDNSYKKTHEGTKKRKKKK